MTRTIVRNNDWKNQDNLWLAAERTSPNSQQNNNNLGDLYARRGDLVKAVYYFQKAVEINPRYADAYHNLGNVNRNMGKTEEAIKSYEKALEINPNIWQSYQNIGAIYYKAQNREKALEYFEKALVLVPDNEGLKKIVEELKAEE